MNEGMNAWMSSSFIFFLMTRMNAWMSSSFILLSEDEQAAGKDDRHLFQRNASCLRQDEPKDEPGDDGDAAVEVECALYGQRARQREEGQAHQQVPAPVSSCAQF
jgi:hypothetical protein